MNVLVSSRPDDVLLGDAVQHRFVEALNLWLRVRGEPIAPPPFLDLDMLNWRTMVARHKNGDYRHTGDELRSTQRVAEWLLRVKCELTGKEYVPIEWEH